MLLENPFENINRSISMVRLGAWAMLRVGPKWSKSDTSASKHWPNNDKSPSCIHIIQLHSFLSHRLLPSCYPNQHHISENKSVPPCKAVQSKHLPPFSFLKEASARLRPLSNVGTCGLEILTRLHFGKSMLSASNKKKNCASASPGRSQQCIPRCSASLVAMYSVSVSNRSSHAQAFDRKTRGRNTTATERSQLHHAMYSNEYNECQGTPRIRVVHLGLWSTGTTNTEVKVSKRDLETTSRNVGKHFRNMLVLLQKREVAAVSPKLIVWSIWNVTWILYSSYHFRYSIYYM